MKGIQTHLGILGTFHDQLDPPFIEKDFFRVLSLYAQKKEMLVTVFRLNEINWKENSVRGYRYHPKQGRWIKADYPIPPLIYDRIFYTSKAQLIKSYFIINRLMKEKRVIFLGRGLPGKWKVYEMCREHPNLLPFLPETIPLTPTTNWQEKLLEHQALFFKPVAGSQGKRVFKLTKAKDGIVIKGRTNRNEIFSTFFPTVRACAAWLRKLSLQKKYIIQPYLSLSTKNQIPFDVRILVQKNQLGRWAETGRVVRLGKKNSLTSNLHGGGTAVKIEPFLEQQYTSEQVQRINSQLETIVKFLPGHLEEKHGSLVELGIDLGIDQEAKVWLLEVNSKPGRRSFRMIQDKNMMKTSLFAPIRYAHYVLSHHGRSI